MWGRRLMNGDIPCYINLLLKIMIRVTWLDDPISYNSKWQSIRNDSRYGAMDEYNETTTRIIVERLTCDCGSRISWDVHQAGCFVEGVSSWWSRRDRWPVGTSGERVLFRTIEFGVLYRGWYNSPDTITVTVSGKMRWRSVLVIYEIEGLKGGNNLNYSLLKYRHSSGR